MVVVLVAVAALVAAVVGPIWLAEYLHQPGHEHGRAAILLFFPSIYGVYRLFDWWLLRPSRSARPPSTWDDPGGGDAGWE
jgi:hypothetical protein